MDTLKTKLTRAIASRFKGAEVKLKGFRAGQRVSGTVIWKGFLGMPQIDRQVKLRRVINKAVADDLQRVSLVLTLTPEEFESISARV